MNLQFEYGNIFDLIDLIESCPKFPVMFKLIEGKLTESEIKILQSKYLIYIF